MQQFMTIEKNEPIADQVYRLVLRGDTSDITAPGQFVNISLPGFFLRRPISVCDWEEDRLVLIYKVVGKGTEYMSALGAGGQLDILSGLGNGFNTGNSGAAPLLVGGGVGTPPLYGLAKRLVRAGIPVNVILGFASEKDAFYIDEFDALNELCGVKVYTATVDGSLGKKGFVTDCLDEIKECSYYYACGPIPMLKALRSAMDERFGQNNGDPLNTGNTAGKGFDGELSLEERMGCGFGACVGCSVMTAAGAKKVCSDGPVFRAGIII